MCGLDAVKGIDGLGDLVPACAPEDLSNLRLINTTYTGLKVLMDWEIPACAPEVLSNLRLINTTYRVKGINGLGDLVPACSAPDDLSNLRLINTTSYRVKGIYG